MHLYVNYMYVRLLILHIQLQCCDCSNVYSLCACNAMDLHVAKLYILYYNCRYTCIRGKVNPPYISYPYVRTCIRTSYIPSDSTFTESNARVRRVLHSL